MSSEPTELAGLVSEWNWDFDPEDEHSLNYAENEIAGYLLNQDDAVHLIGLIRPYLRQEIVNYLNYLRSQDD